MGPTHGETSTRDGTKLNEDEYEKESERTSKEREGEEMVEIISIRTYLNA